MTKENNKKVRAVVIFYIIAISIRYLTNETTLLSKLHNLFLEIILQGIGPAIGALVVFKVFSIKPTLTLSGGYKNQWLPYIIYWAIPIIILGAISLITKEKFSLVVLPVLVYALLEEIGWRGFLQPALSFLPKFTCILLVTILWFIWHLNFALSISNLIFFLVLLAGSWGIGAVANKTHSLIAVSAFHAVYDIYSLEDNLPLYLIAILVIIFITWLLAVIYYPKLSSAKV
jgi:uncharacterized protein